MEIGMGHMGTLRSSILVRPVPCNCKFLAMASSTSFSSMLHACPPSIHYSCRRLSSLIIHARKKNIHIDPSLEKTAFDEEEEVEPEEEFDDGIMMDEDDYFEDEFEDPEPVDGDGGGGGGIVLAGTWWERKALDIAQNVVASFNGDFKIYSFQASLNDTIRIRIEKLSNKYGSPSMGDIGIFSMAYRERLDEAEHAGAVPESLSLEVSSPGVERIVQVPQELDRFKDLPMYVKYVGEMCVTGSLREKDGILRLDSSEDNSNTQISMTNSLREKDGIFKLESIEMESSHCIWSLADVKKNKESTGKGRPLSKKKREWRLRTPFNSLRLVRLYSDC